MVQRWNVCAIVFWRVVWYRAGTFPCMRSWPCMSWPRRARPSCRGRGRRAVAVASLGVAVAVASVASWTRPCRGCGVVICVAVARLRHADEC